VLYSFGHFVALFYAYFSVLQRQKLTDFFQANCQFVKPVCHKRADLD